MGGIKWYYAFLFAAVYSKIKLEGYVNSSDIVSQCCTMDH